MKDGKCCVVCKLVSIVVSIGAINWGTSAFFQLDLVAQFLGAGTAASKIVYGVVGVAGVIKLVSTLIPVCPCQRAGGSCSK